MKVFCFIDIYRFCYSSYHSQTLIIFNTLTNNRFDFCQRHSPNIFYFCKCVLSTKISAINCVSHSASKVSNLYKYTDLFKCLYVL